MNSACAALAAPASIAAISNPRRALRDALELDPNDTDFLPACSRENAWLLLKTAAIVAREKPRRVLSPRGDSAKI